MFVREEERRETERRSEMNKLRGWGWKNAKGSKMGNGKENIQVVRGLSRGCCASSWHAYLRSRSWEALLDFGACTLPLQRALLPPASEIWIFRLVAHTEWSVMLCVAVASHCVTSEGLRPRSWPVPTGQKRARNRNDTPASNDRVRRYY